MENYRRISVTILHLGSFYLLEVITSTGLSGRFETCGSLEIGEKRLAFY